MKINLGKYRHFKGKEYEVIGIARDCEDVNKQYVVYKALYDSEEFGKDHLWVREINDFLGNKEIDGKIVKRFEYIGKNMKIKIKKLTPKAIIPKYAQEGDAGMDVYAITKNETSKFVEYGTGLSFEIPQGYVCLVFPRSSISKKDLILANSVGVLDSEYRGELKFRFRKTGEEDYKIGERIGQIMILPYPKIEFEEVGELSETSRAGGGFGSTGI